MNPQDYASWQRAIQAAPTRASLHTLESRVRALTPDAEALRLRQWCGQRRRALGTQGQAPTKTLAADE